MSTCQFCAPYFSFQVEAQVLILCLYIDYIWGKNNNTHNLCVCSSVHILKFKKYYVLTTKCAVVHCST